jgi:hypothetical protein
MIKPKRMKWAGHLACMGETRNACGVLVGQLKRKRPLGRPIRSWDDNVKIDLREIVWGDMDWINLAQDSVQWWALLNQ